MKDLIRKILNENEFDWLDSGKDILQSKGFNLMDYLINHLCHSQCLCVHIADVVFKN